MTEICVRVSSPVQNISKTNILESSNLVNVGIEVVTLDKQQLTVATEQLKLLEHRYDAIIKLVRENTK